MRDVFGLATYALIMSIGQACFKRASSVFLAGTGGYVRLFANPYFVAACLIYALATVLWVRILAEAQISSAYPFAIGASILLTTLTGVILFGERLSLPSLIGIVLVLVGIGLVSLGFNGDQG